MTNEQLQLIVWIFFMVFILVFSLWLITYLRKRNKRKAKQREELMAFKENYEHLNVDKIDELDGNELISAVIMQCQRKEEADELNYFDSLNEVERIVYGVYQLNQSLSASTGIKSFFMSPAMEEFAPHIDQYFEKAGSHELAKLIKNARKLNEIMENDLEDEDMGDYSTYNFSDFTHEYRSLIVSSNFQEKLAQYIKANKDLFKEEEENEVSDSLQS